MFGERRTSPRLANKANAKMNQTSKSSSSAEPDHNKIESKLDFEPHDETLIDEMALLVGQDTAKRISEAKVLVVGAGGIGCELLKSLVMSGFTYIEIVDLDTIDVSNLNRQFLFRKKHVGMSKSKVAAEAALNFLHDEYVSGESGSGRDVARIVSHQGNIMTSQFGAKFFQKFDLILNALDNAEARRYVNRICISLKKSLVESGTGGYQGQVKPIVRGVTECFECDPSLSASKQKVYPVCTIRNSPDKPIHTIVWAKHVFNALFGPKENDADNLMKELTLDIDTTGPITEEQALSFAQKFFKKHFEEDVLASAQVKERWISRDPPVAIELNQVWKKGQNYERNDQTVGSISDNASMFFNAIEKLITTRSDEFGALTFDKDDRLALEFVAAASNLRMHNYGINRLSLFDIKGIAGNIIHAIATTNAIAAGLMVIQAVNILALKHDELRTTWITTAPPAVLAPEKMRAANPKCPVCSVAHALITIDTSRWTLRKFFEKIIRGHLELEQASIDVENRDNFLDIEEELSDLQLNQIINSPGIRIDDGSQLFLSDDELLLNCRLLISHQDGLEGFEFVGDMPNPFEPKEEDVENGQNKDSMEVDEIEHKTSKESNHQLQTLSGSKRPLAALLDLTEDNESEILVTSGKKQKIIALDD